MLALALRRALATILLLMFAANAAWAATVVFNLTDFLQETPTLQRRVLQIQPITAVRGNTTNLVITAERRAWNTGTNAQVTVTNMVAGIYGCYVLGGTWTSSFRVNIPDTNGTLYASDLITSPSSGMDYEDGTPMEFE